MSSYTNIFGGSLLTPTQNFYEAITLSSNILLAWSTDFGPNPRVVARIMDISPTGAGYTVTMPSAENISVGFSFSINNKTAYSFTLLANDLTTISIINTGFYTFYLTNNTTAAGSWTLLPFTGTSAVTSVGITTTSNGNITVANSPITVSGDINLSLAKDLLGLTSFGDEVGIAVRDTITGTWSTVSLLGTAGQIVLTNGNGILGNPVISLADAISGIDSIDLEGGNINIGVVPNTISANNSGGGLNLYSESTGNGPININAGASGVINLNPTSSGVINSYRNLIIKGGNSLVLSNTSNTQSIGISGFLTSSTYGVILPPTIGTPSQVLGIASVVAGIADLEWQNASSAGTVTSITAGANLTATPNNPITTAGTIALDAVLTGLTSITVGDIALSADTIESSTSLGLGAASSITLAPGSGFAVNLINGLTAVPLRFWNSASTFYTAFQAGSPTVDTTFTLPIADGTNGQVLSTNGSAILSWANGGGGSSINTNVLSPQLKTYTALTTDNVIIANTIIYPIIIILPEPTPTEQPAIGQAYEIIDGKGTSILNSIYLKGSGFQVNAQDATQVISVASPLTSGNSPETAIVTPDGNWAYICNGGASTLTVIENASSSTPTVVSTTLPADGTPQGIAVTPNGNYVYTASGGSTTVTVVANASSGGFTSSNLPVGTDPEMVAITPNGQYAFIPNNGTNDVSYIINAQGPTTPSVGGAITDLSINNPVFAAVSPDGNYLYIANDTNPGIITVFSGASSGSPVIATTVTTGIGSGFVAFSPNGQYAYVLNSVDGTVSIIQNASTNTPSVLATLPTQTDPSWLAVTPDGNFIYVTNYSSNSVTVMQNMSTQAPSVLTNLAVATGPTQIQIASNGQYAYVGTNAGDVVNIIKNVSTYNPVVLPTFSSGFSNPLFLCITPNNSNVFASNSTNNTITIIQNEYYGSGNIDFPNAVYVGQIPSWVAFTPDGKRAFVPTQAFETVTVFEDAYSSSPETLTTALSSLYASPTQIVITPNGEYAYGISGFVGNIAQYSNVSSGFPTTNGGPSVGASSAWEAITQDGANLYIVCPGTPGSVYVFSGASQGLLAGIGGSPFTVGTGPNFVVITPNAQYAYVLNNNDGTISYFSAANTLSPTLALTPLIVGGTPNQMVITPNGQYGYVTTGSSTVAFITSASGPTPTVGTAITVTGTTDLVGIAISPDGNTVLVTDEGNNLLGVITGASSGTPVFSQTIAVGTDPSNVAITPDGNIAVIVNSTDNTVSIIGNVSTAPYVITTVPVGPGPENVFIHPSGNYAWIPASADYSATIINTSSHFVLSNGEFSYENVIYDGQRWVAS